VVTNYLDNDPTRLCTRGEGYHRDFCGPRHFSGTVSKLYRNLGLKDQKSEVTSQKSEVRSPSSDLRPLTSDLRSPNAQPLTPRFEAASRRSVRAQLAGPALGVVCAVYTGDGCPDILTPNDTPPNRLWINQRDGTFKDEAVQRGIAYDAYGQMLGNMG